MTPFGKKNKERQLDVLPEAATLPLEPPSPAFEETGRPYRDQWELMTDVFAVIDYRLYIFYKAHQWVGPRNDMRNMLGLVVTREEFEHNLVKAAQTGLMQHASGEDRLQIELGERTVRERIEASTREMPLICLFERFALSEFERNVVLLAYAGTLDSKYERLFGYLQDDITRKTPSVSLAVQLYLPDGGTVEEYIAYFDRETPFTSLFDAGELSSRNLVLNPGVAQYLSSGSVAPGAGMTLFDGMATPPSDPLIGGGEIKAALDLALQSKESVTVTLTGEPGSGRRFQVKHLMARTGERCLFADMETLEHKADAVARAALNARLADAYVCFTGLDTLSADGALEPPPAELIDAIDRMDRAGRCAVFLISQKPVYRPSTTASLDCPIPPLTAHDRIKLFEHYFSGVPLAAEVSLEELASKFRFTPHKIKLAAHQTMGLCRINGGAPADNQTVHRCCYRQVVHRLDRLAVSVEPRYSWDDVVMPEAQKRLMQQACAHIRYSHKVYQDWGFEKKIGYGKGLSILFAGAPGTGKTMCAQVIAKQLNMQMYKINISQIVSKYIGETEKNLQALFAEARRSNCILFFDECDAIFGKRSDVKDAHDRNANVEVAYLLQQIEDHDGVCVLATNLIQNIDAAFMRRITYVVHFPFPDADMRREIYLHTLSPDAPLEAGIDWDFMAKRFELSGGHIKNIVLEAAFMAAAAGKAIGMRELVNAAVNELKKNEMVVVREELREYADLIGK